MTTSLAGGDPGCPGSVTTSPPVAEAGASAAPARALAARRVAFGEIDAGVWDSLVDASPAATPFSRRCVHEAWWTAYGANAHDQTLAVFEPDQPDRIVGIAPLMHRHALEPGDVAARTALRHAGGPGTLVPENATAVFFGASYHADYATLLAAPESLPAVADAVVAELADPASASWDVVDLRRLRCGDPAADALAAAFARRADAEGWHLIREREDVCPVLTLPGGMDFEAYLSTLGKKERHEIRRKVRRAEAVGEVELVTSPNSQADVEAFIELHQKRWGAEGLFPPTEGGKASRTFFAGLIADCSDFVDLSFLTVGGKRIAAGVTFDDGDSIYYYNAGVDPEAHELSPGVLMVSCYVKRAIEQGRRRLDFLRGEEPYKYDWGAVDEPLQRLLVARTAGERPEGRS